MASISEIQNCFFESWFINVQEICTNDTCKTCYMLLFWLFTIYTDVCVKHCIDSLHDVKHNSVHCTPAISTIGSQFFCVHLESKDGRQDSRIVQGVNSQSPARKKPHSTRVEVIRMWSFYSFSAGLGQAPSTKCLSHIGVGLKSNQIYPKQLLNLLNFYTMLITWKKTLKTW